MASILLIMFGYLNDRACAAKPSSTKKRKHVEDGDHAKRSLRNSELDCDKSTVSTVAQSVVCCCQLLEVVALACMTSQYKLLGIQYQGLDDNIGANAQPWLLVQLQDVAQS